MRKVTIRTFPLTPDAAEYVRESKDGINKILIIGSAPIGVKFITKTADGTLLPPDCHILEGISDTKTKEDVMLWLGDYPCGCAMTQEALDHLLLY